MYEYVEYFILQFLCFVKLFFFIGGEFRCWIVCCGGIVLRQGQNTEHMQPSLQMTLDSYLGTQIFIRGKNKFLGVLE